MAAGVCQCGPTHQSLLPHSQDGRVGLQVDPGAALHRLQTLHRDVGRVAQPQADQVEHPAGVPLRTESVSPPRNGLHDRVMRHFNRPPHGFTCNRYKPVCRKLLTFYDSCSRRTCPAELHSQVLVFCGFFGLTAKLRERQISPVRVPVMYDPVFSSAPFTARFLPQQTRFKILLIMVHCDSCPQRLNCFTEDGSTISLINSTY